MSVLFNLISARGAWLQARHGVLAQNVANADTPHYKPHDLKGGDFDDLLRRAARPERGLGLVGTQAGHIAAKPLATLDTAGREVDGFETSLSGNEVVLEEQTEAMMQTRLDYEMTTNLYRKYLGMLRTAVGTAGG